jgi:hypothetical protein
MRTIHPHSAVALLSALFLLLLGATGCRDNPVDASDNALVAASQPVALSKVQDEFEDAEVFFEFNSTDNDLGLQIFLDAEGWDKVDVSDPDNHKIFQIHTQGTLSDLGITELRFESAEPSPAEVLALFPPGDYEFIGKTVEGGTLASTAELSHDLLAAPTFTPSDGDEVDPNNAVISWNAPGAELVEVIIESEENDNVFDVIVSGSETSLDVPSQFLEPDTEYKIEVLAIAENGNKTITESTFVTMP